MVVFKLDKINALDEYKAIEFVSILLSLGKASTLLFPGELDVDFTSDYFVLPTRSRSGKRIKGKGTASRRIVAYSSKSAHSQVFRVRDLMFGQGRSTEITGAGIIHSLMTASLAEQTEANQVKLVTSWAALEALLPNVPRDATNRISHFLEYSIPAATLSYPRDHFVELHRALKRLFNKPLVRFLGGIVAEGSDVDKLAKVIIAGTTSEQSKLISIVSKSPVALFRLKHLQDSFSEPTSMNQYLADHENRVKWQIQRIYGERNHIVHSGQPSPYVEDLVTNCMSYYLLIMRNIDLVWTCRGIVPLL